MRSQLPIIIAFALLTPACAPSVEEHVAAQRPMAEAKLAKVAKVRDLARAAPRIESEGLVDPGPMSLCELMVPAHREAPCDTFAIALDQLESPRRYLSPKPVVDYGPTEWLVLTTSLLETGRYPPNAEYPEGAEVDRLTNVIEHAFRWLANLRYLIVVKPVDFTAPSVPPDQKSYVAGSIVAEAHLFALDPEPRPLGAVQFDFAMSGDIKVRLKRGKVPEVELGDAFSRAVRKALVEKLAGHLAKLEPPPK